MTWISIFPGSVFQKYSLLTPTHASFDDRSDRIRMLSALYIVSTGVLVLVAVFVLSWAAGYSLSELGVYPRTLSGLKGIIFSPFIHADVFHLISNAVPIFLLGMALYYFYNTIATRVLIAIMFCSGLLVWLFARPAYHIGASGIVYGLIIFLLISGLIRKDGRSTILSLVVIFLYGGSILSGFIPLEEQISWEAHAFGACCGLILALYYRNKVFWMDDLAAQEEARLEEGVDTTDPDSSPGTGSTSDQSVASSQFTYHFIPGSGKESGKSN